MVSRLSWLLGVGASFLWCFASASASEPAAVAKEVGRLLTEEIQAKSPAAPLVDDSTFLRRAHLDLVGEIPKPGEATAFLIDPATDKRAQLIEKLLADPRFGRNWGRYYRDVIMYRKTEERAAIIQASLQDYLIKSFNENKPWSQIATEMITAEGDALEKGECGLIVAQQGQPEEVVAEISRIFMGVQIQCAQCHDHPWDRWKREEFHELAAFFPRVASRVILTPDNRTVTVTATDFTFARGRPGNNAMRFRGTTEHYMSDLMNPESRGTLMKPVLFATGDELSTGVKDAERRGKLAEWITKKDNTYFSQAFVNRIWGELCGEGFYEPLDDIGPDRECSAPKTMEYLAQEFANADYDVKWLFRTIMQTELYQRQCRARRNPEELPFQANVAQRLRADVVLDNLYSVLGIKAAEETPTGYMALRGNARNTRAIFNAVFGYDPSQRRDEVLGSIPQSLDLMNSPPLQSGLSGKTIFTDLGRTLTRVRNDSAMVDELYLGTLGREPSDKERSTCLAYVKEVGNRVEAFEDLQWSLINSTEFLYRN